MSTPRLVEGRLHRPGVYPDPLRGFNHSACSRCPTPGSRSIRVAGASLPSPLPAVSSEGRRHASYYPVNSRLGDIEGPLGPAPAPCPFPPMRALMTRLLSPLYATLVDSAQPSIIPYLLKIILFLCASVLLVSLGAPELFGGAAAAFVVAQASGFTLGEIVPGSPSAVGSDRPPANPSTAGAAETGVPATISSASDPTPAAPAAPAVTPEAPAGPLSEPAQTSTRPAATRRRGGRSTTTSTVADSAPVAPATPVATLEAPVGPLSELPPVPAGARFRGPTALFPPLALVCIIIALHIAGMPLSLVNGRLILTVSAAAGLQPVVQYAFSLLAPLVASSGPRVIAGAAQLLGFCTMPLANLVWLHSICYGPNNLIYTPGLVYYFVDAQGLALIYGLTGGETPDGRPYIALGHYTGNQARAICAELNAKFGLHGVITRDRYVRILFTVADGAVFRALPAIPSAP